MIVKMAEVQDVASVPPAENSDRDDLIDSDETSQYEPTGLGATLACDPRRSLHRYLVLILMCLLSFGKLILYGYLCCCYTYYHHVTPLVYSLSLGSYFCYDNPAALQDDMLQDLSVNEESYMMFYSMYVLRPNVK